MFQIPRYFMLIFISLVILHRTPLKTRALREHIPPPRPNTSDLTYECNNDNPFKTSWILSVIRITTKINHTFSLPLLISRENSSKFVHNMFGHFADRQTYGHRTSTVALTSCFYVATGKDKQFNWYTLNSTNNDTIMKPI